MLKSLLTKKLRKTVLNLTKLNQILLTFQEMTKLSDSVPAPSTFVGFSSGAEENQIIMHGSLCPSGNLKHEQLDK